MILSSEPFIPHSLEHLTNTRVFPSPLPESFYNKICKEYDEAKDAVTNKIVYSSDGLKVTGISSLPNEIKEKSHPILIYNRGGSREYGKLTVLSAMRSMIPFARAGYMVFASNYRGNDGGEGREEFGGADVNDILNLLEIAKKHAAWDGKNVFMLGHSRGGMMNALALRRGLKANSVVSIAGISDLRQWRGERSSMEQNVYKPNIPDYMADPLAALTARSPICWADEITSPLLLLHGTADEAVEISHSISLSEKLNEYEKHHELISYDGGNHALLRYWDDVLAKSINWFERYRISTTTSPFQREQLFSSPSPFQGEGWGEGKKDML